MLIFLKVFCLGVEDKCKCLFHIDNYLRKKKKNRMKKVGCGIVLVFPRVGMGNNRPMQYA